MERNFDGASRDEAADALKSLSADRARLARRLRVPWGLMAAFGALGAWWVATAAASTPGENYDPPQSGWLALLGVLVVAHLVQRDTGIRFRTMGAKATWFIAAVVAVCLGLFSVSLALVSLDMRWLVAITSLAAFAATTWLSGAAYRAAVESLRRD